MAKKSHSVGSVAGDIHIALSSVCDMLVAAGLGAQRAKCCAALQRFQDCRYLSPCAEMQSTVSVPCLPARILQKYSQ